MNTRNAEALPTQESMRGNLKVRRFREVKRTVKPKIKVVRGSQGRHASALDSSRS